MEQKANTFLETEPLGALMAKYAVPCVISLLAAALYNIVDQIFIANADYLGSCGNAANTVVFPLTVVALAVAVMIGDGCCAFVSIKLGSGDRAAAHRSIGSAVLLCVSASLVLTALYLALQEPILTLFGGRVNEETFRHAREYFLWITLGVPFYMFGQAMNPIIRSDGSPRFAMASTLAAEAVVGAAALVIVELFPRQLIAIFGAANESVYYTEYAVKCFRVYLCMMVLATVNKGTFIYLQSLGKAFASTAISLVREVLFGVGFALLLPLRFGLDGVLYSMPVSDVLTFAICVLVIRYTCRELSSPGEAALRPCES